MCALCNANVFYPHPHPPPAAEDKMGWHGKALPKDMMDSVVRDLQTRLQQTSKQLYPALPKEDTPPVSLRNMRMPSAPSYQPGDKVIKDMGEVRLGQGVGDTQNIHIRCKTDLVNSGSHDEQR